MQSKDASRVLEKETHAVERRWTWFFRGFGVGFSLAVLITGLIVSFVVVPWLEQRAPPEPSATWVEIIPDISMPTCQQEVTLSLVLNGEPMVPPISMIWTADCGEGLPKGRVAVTTAYWRAPEYTTVAHIEATVNDSEASVAKGKLVLPVVTSGQPGGKIER